MNRQIVAALFISAAFWASTADAYICLYTNDVEELSYFFAIPGQEIREMLDAYAQRSDLSNDDLGNLLLEIAEPVFESACGSAYPAKEYLLCEDAIYAMEYLKTTNALPFLEKAVLTGSKKFSQDAFHAYGEITQYDESFIDLGDRAAGKCALPRAYYINRMSILYEDIRDGRKQVTPENRLRIESRVVGNPSDNYMFFSRTEGMLLADFPFYTNSVERLKALSVLVDNAFTPPEVRAKYEPERDRLKALPPEELVCATDVLNAQLDALLKAAERKKAIAGIRRVAVPAVAVILFVTGLVFIRKNVLVRKRNSVGHV